MDLSVQSLSALLEVIAIKDFTLNVYILSAISISFDVFEKSILVLVQFPRKLLSFTGRTPETLRGSLSDHMVPTLVLALPLLLGYTYFPCNLILKFLF